MASAVPGTVLQADRHVDFVAHGCYAGERADGIDDDKLSKQARAEQCRVERVLLVCRPGRRIGSRVSPRCGVGQPPKGRVLNRRPRASWSLRVYDASGMYFSSGMLKSLMSGMVVEGRPSLVSL